MRLVELQILLPGETGECTWSHRCSAAGRAGVTPCGQGVGAASLLL
ncbi:hypothetical protein IG631_11940 [Alternaria alternata]|nr:hypothetical protein IG631_11940 [Alternaria alternata]